jgi:uncharacterized protein (DUF305 family)
LEEVEVVIHRTAVILLAIAAGASCKSAGGVHAQPPSTSTPIIRPGAPGQSSQVISADQASDLSKVQFTPADVKFMQGMIGHHAQAVEMTDLLATRTNREDMKMLAQRIAVSQNDEMNMMRRWLEVRGQAQPNPHAHHMPGMLMPGMLTQEEMAALAAAKGPEFDRLFLEGMIKHHGGALTMVQELFASPGAGQESEIFAFASDVDADQRMEIDRMRAMLVVH